MSKKTLIAFGSVPKDGGTFTFYRNLRRPLLEHGFDLRCVSVGRQEAELWEPDYADEGCVMLAADTASRKKQAMAFADWCRREHADIVIAVNSVAMLSALPHLPEEIRTVSRCANAFDHGYRITVSSYERLSRIVALAPRQIADLVASYGSSEDRITLIPNGADPARFEASAARERGGEAAIRLGFLGRLEHNQKGVLFLPNILRRLRGNGVTFTLDIAGKGVHESALRRELADFVETGAVTFHGTLPRSEIAGFLSRVDIFLFPSQFEGSPNALIEAIMAGCVPAAWRVEGITDFLIEDGHTGVLENLGDCNALADRITLLANRREALRQLSANAAESARRRFSLNRLVGDYVALFGKVMAERPRPWKARDWSSFRVDPAFRELAWKGAVPAPFKKAVRKAIYHLGLGNRDA